MITLKQYFEIINYRVSEGYQFQWRCYGPNAYGLESVDNRHPAGHSIGIIFDTQNQTVYQVEAHDYKNNRSYRLVNAEFSEARLKECRERGLEDVAYDDVKFIDLETAEDFIEKATAIANGEEYDARISIPVDLPDNVLFTLMKQAHEQDITLNAHMEKVLREVIEDMAHGIDC